MAVNVETVVTRTLGIAEIARDPAFQMRAGLDSGAVKRYSVIYSQGGEMPPVEVALVEGVYILVDGWHRIAALELLSIGSVAAVVGPAVTRQAALLRAVEVNLTHGLPLRPAARRKAFQTFILARGHILPRKKHMSYADLAQRLGMAKGTMHAWMRKDFPRIAKAMGEENDFKGTGGLTERPTTPPQTAAAMDGLRQLQAAFAATSSPTERAVIVAAAQEAVEAMQGTGDYPPRNNDF